MCTATGRPVIPAAVVEFLESAEDLVVPLPISFRTTRAQKRRAAERESAQRHDVIARVVAATPASDGSVTIEVTAAEAAALMPLIEMLVENAAESGDDPIAVAVVEAAEALVFALHDIAAA